MDKLPICDANYVPLSPISFLKRAAVFYANRDSIIYQGIRFTWYQTYARCIRLASSLSSSLNITKNDVVSVLAPNIPAMYELHFAVAMAGAVLNTINTRLDANNVATILKHSEAKLLFVDYQYEPLARDALRLVMSETPKNVTACPLLVVIDDIESKKAGIRRPERLEYEQLIEMGDPNFIPVELKDECDPIALNYTSGTTSTPKGVVYSHRGAYLSTMSSIIGWQIGSEPVYLWTLPMFHCNGWCFPWGIAARGGTNVCIRNTTAHDIYRNIALHHVTHMCCAPTVLNILSESELCFDFSRMKRNVQVLTGGAPPPPTILEQMENLGFRITHAYGLTEATGMVLVCEWQGQWNRISPEKRAKMKTRQGVSVLALADVAVKDPKTQISVPNDGETMGEIVLKGSSLMKGYYKDRKATVEAFNHGWFWTGDVAVVHPDGYIDVKDRSKDVIISGGENISSVELENVLYRHPGVMEAAVVAMPHPIWGESPCAFLVPKTGPDGETEGLSEREIINYCRKNLPTFMVPKKIEFLKELPRTSTGKPLKSELRTLAKDLVLSSGTPSQSRKLSFLAANVRKILMKVR